MATPWFATKMGTMSMQHCVPVKLCRQACWLMTNRCAVSTSRRSSLKPASTCVPRVPSTVRRRDAHNATRTLPPKKRKCWRTIGDWLSWSTCRTKHSVAPMHRLSIKPRPITATIPAIPIRHRVLGSNARARCVITSTTARWACLTHSLMSWVLLRSIIVLLHFSRRGMRRPFSML